MRSKVVIASFLLAVTVFSSPEAGAQSIGVGAGVVELDNRNESSLYLTANLRFRLIGPLQLEPEVGYWKRTLAVPGGEASSEDLHLGANALLVFPAGAFEFFGGVGVGAHFLDRSAGFEGLARDVAQTDAAIHLLAGLDVKLGGSLSLFGVARQDSFEDDAGSPDQTKFYGGLRLRF